MGKLFGISIIWSYASSPLAFHHRSTCKVHSTNNSASWEPCCRTGNRNLARKLHGNNELPGRLRVQCCYLDLKSGKTQFKAWSTPACSPIAFAIAGHMHLRPWIESEKLLTSRPVNCVSRQSEHGSLGAVSPLENSEPDAVRPSEDGILEQEARQAVLRVLVEAGLSLDDAEVAVSKAPVFIRELIACVKDMDGNDILDKGEGLHISEEVDRRDKLYELASHGKGLSPFLESLRVNLSSISKISFSLSQQRLPELLSKVHYLEAIFSNGEPRDRPLDGLIRYMLKNLSVSVWEDEDIQRTLSFFEKMKQTEGGLLALEESASVVSLLIEGFPQIFRRSLDHQIKPVVQFLESLGVKGNSDLGKIILCYPAILLQDPEKDLLPRKRNLKAVGIRVQDMGRMLVRYPWLLSGCVANNIEKLAQFLESIKVPKSKIDRSITRYPYLLGCSSTSALAPVVEHISTYGLTGRPLGRAISQSPELLVHSPREFDSVVSYLQSVGVEDDTISKLLRRSPEIMGASIENTLQRKVKVLEELGVRHSKLGRIIKFFPEILTISVDSSLLPRIKHLRGWGFSKNEISRMVFKFPPLLGYDVETVLRPKLEYLTATMRRSVKDVVAYPRYFSHSLEKKIKPRARVLANRQIQCDVKDMLAKSDDRFAAEFLGFESMWIPMSK